MAERLPRHWPEALQRFQQSAFIRTHFGPEFQRILTLMKEQEMDDFDRQVTPLEYDACL